MLRAQEDSLSKRDKIVLFAEVEQVYHKLNPEENIAADCTNFRGLVINNKIRDNPRNPWQMLLVLVGVMVDEKNITRATRT